MKDLDKTHLRISIITDVEGIHSKLRDIFREVYDEARDLHLVGNNKEKKVDADTIAKHVRLLREGRVREYKDWLRDVSDLLCEYLNKVFAVSKDSTVDLGCILDIMEPEFYIEPTVRTPDTLEQVPGKMLGDRNSIEVIPGELRIDLDEAQSDAIDNLFNHFDGIIAAQRELYDRYSPAELIRFRADRSTGFILIEFWGDVRIHLYNQLKGDDEWTTATLS